MSCLGKLFTSIFNKRLNADSYEFVLINESQVGFRHEYSTNENIISLHSLFELLTLKKKCSVYSWILIKAFEAVWREGLWCTLLMNQIIGKMHKVIVNNVP